jgi:dolichyl-phosphate beta-glucosyltransferase
VISTYNTSFISIIIPAYNESNRIIQTITKIDKYLKDRIKDYEIIVINDGSHDNTSEIISTAKKKTGNLKLISYGQNKGKGYAIKQGVKAARGNIILITDADLSTPIEELEKLLIHYNNGYNIVIGSRGLTESNIIKKQPWWRETMGKIFNRLVRFMFSEEIRDTQCGFKLFKGDICKGIFEHSTVDRFAYDVEIIQIARELGYSIKEVPVQWIHSPDSKVNPLKDSLQMLKDLMKIRLRRF